MSCWESEYSSQNTLNWSKFINTWCNNMILYYHIKIHLYTLYTWQFCWWPFWDGENVTFLNGCWWPPARGWKGHGLNHLVPESSKYVKTHLANGPWNKSLNFIFPTKYVIPKSLKFSHWPSKKMSCLKPWQFRFFESAKHPNSPTIASLSCWFCRPGMQKMRVFVGLLNAFRQIIPHIVKMSYPCMKLT